MIKTLKRKMLAVAAVATVAFALGVQDANAGSWGSYGSDGGSYGSSGGSVSYGSSGSYGSFGSHGGSGSYGSYGSHGSSGGGGLLARLASRIHNHFHSHFHGSSGGGSYGSHGSSGGSYGSYGSGGGSYGSYGSSGGSYGSYGSVESYKIVPDAIEVQEDDMIEAPAGAGEAPAEGAGDQQTLLRRNGAILTVSVPMNAKVFVNGYETQTTGTSRSYVSRNLVPGFGYTYEVRAEMMVDGKKVEETKSVDLRAGATRNLAFNFAPVENPVTTLTLNVPENAQVTLAGSQTKSTGAVRVFTTTKLTKGSEWSDYKIVVSVERDGKQLTKEETIALKAGATQSLNFDFTENRVAAAVR